MHGEGSLAQLLKQLVVHLLGIQAAEQAIRLGTGLVGLSKLVKRDLFGGVGGIHGGVS